MSRDSGRRFRFIPFVTIVVVGALALLLVALFVGRRTFPALAAGAYTGKISGVTGSNSDFATLYVERIRNSNAFLFVVFSEGWKPQIILAEVEQTNQEQAPSFQPVTITNERGESWTLYGGGNAAEYAGKASRGEKNLGMWTLEQLPHDQLRAEVQNAPGSSELKEWLEYKGRYYRLFSEYKSLSETVTEKQAKVAKLSSYVSDEQLLREKAKQRSDELQNELKTLQQDKQNKQEELAKAVRELEQLIRITKRGRTIELARRVAKRENKWYFVNWEKGQDMTAIEQTIAQNMNIDPSKLEANVKRAEELLELKNCVDKERGKIAELQQMYLEKTQVENQERLKTEQKPEQQEPDKSWWQNIF